MPLPLWLRTLLPGKPPPTPTAPENQPSQCREVTNDDPIAPTSIEHNIDEIWDGDDLQQYYNYLVYNFETPTALIWARVYLDAPFEVTIYGPMDPTDRTRSIDDPELVRKAKAYLQRRYTKVKHPA